MSMANPRHIPTSLAGIKRLASSIKKQTGTKHSSALNEAAIIAGFNNFKEARNCIGSQVVKSTLSLYITAYWREARGGTGRETLEIPVRRQWSAELTLSQLRRTRFLRHFRFDAVDHLETPEDLGSQDFARQRIIGAVRELTFMEASGLRPLSGRLPASIRRAYKLPHRDHASEWRNPDTGAAFLVDEPYGNPERLLAERQTWSATHRFEVALCQWNGMYSPGHSHLFVTAERGDSSLARIVSRVDALPPPAGDDEWSGTSAAYAPPFASPARLASGVTKRARPVPLLPGVRHKGVVGFGGPLVGLGRRPDGRMPLSAHREAGGLLKAMIESSGLPSRAWTNLNRVRSELDEWVQREFSRQELSDEVFSKLYYGEVKPLPLPAPQAVSRVADLLREHYPDVPPRRSAERLLASARRMIERAENTN